MDPNEQPEPTLPPAEQMRQRRLAKLAGPNNAASSTQQQQQQQQQQPPPQQSPAPPQASEEAQPSPNPSSSSAKENERPAEIPNRNIDITPSSGTSSPSTNPSTSNPFSQLGVKNTPESRSGTPTVSDSGNNGTLKRSAPVVDMPSANATPPPKKLYTAPKEESLEDWSDRVLSDIFRVTLDEPRAVDSRGNGGAKLTYLPELRSELEQSAEPSKLTTSSIDAAILEAARYVPAAKPLLDYLLPCWKRVMRALKTTARRPNPDRDAVLNEAKRLCMSNCIFAVTMPEYFGRDPNIDHDSLKPYLLRHGDNEYGICADFFEEALSRVDEDDTVLPMFTGAMVQISDELATMNMNQDYKPHITSLVTYARYPRLLQALAHHDKFLVTPTADMAKEQLALASEERTILGPFFRISPLQTEVTKTYFTGPRTIDAGHKKQAQTALQMTLKAHQGDLATIINAFVRVKDARNKTLDWFAFIFNMNHKRRALQVRSDEVASDGFMVNVTAVLDQLCQPFMDNTFSKVSKIDVDYLCRNPRIDMSDETKLNADQATAEAFYGRKVGGESNFISEVFFLALAAHHYGLGATNSKLKDLDREIKHVESAIKHIEEQLAKVPSKQHQNAVQAVEKAIALKYSIEGVVLDQSMQTVSLQFMRYVSVWLLRVASGTDYIPGRLFQLPLPPQQPEAFSCLPEYALQDVVDNFKFVFRFIPQILISAVGEEIITLCITFLRSSEYIKNPYLKSSLVTLLFSGTWPIYHLKRGVLGDALAGSEFANEHLLHALMKCGVSSAFYDKFNIRYEIFQVLKCIWPNTVYQDQLSRESKVNKQFFVQFVNLLLNDATFLLDEALTKLYKIHDFQKQLRDQSLSAQDREKVTSDLEATESQCLNWMTFLNDTMAMMKLFTAALRDAFTIPEIVTRLAGMLDYNLEVLVGPRRANLKVEDPKKYHFDAKTLLAEFIDIYLNLGSKQTFIDAIAGDGRSYKPANFETASQILSANLNAAPETAAAWDSLRKKIAEAKERLDQAELDLGEIPEEFEDPLMGDLMKDPVILPSRNIVDRSTIVQQLLSNPLDPFTRAPMKIEDVVPADDLRMRIEAWKAERIAEAKAKTTADPMDTSSG
ncbi:hypothetical protein DL767_004915 [Monosporascus sp. MG133]|nr:hypothetical protein DL767_004915 [Monosporascus sp. MG133]